MLERLSLVAYRKAAITPDLAEAMRQLEMRAAQAGGMRLAFKSRPQGLDWAKAEREPGPTECPPAASLWIAGREARIRIHFTSRPANRWDEVSLLWSLAVPLGFTPWSRYPMPGRTDEVFHFLGPWQGLYDHLCGEGRGELAWPSVCAAAQVDVGRWQGDRWLERFVQAQLHRLGHHCGPVDGVVGPRTLAALRSIGLHSGTLEKAAQALCEHETPEVSERQRKVGYIIAPGQDLAVNAFGRVQSTRTRNGAALTIDGPGRVVIDVQGGV